MKRFLIICCLSGFALASCVKDRMCECKNENSTYDAGETKATKARAKKYCKSLSSDNTKCYLK